MKGHGWYQRGKGRGKKPLGDLSDPLGLPARVTAYLAWMRIKNYSPITVYTREKALLQMLEWAKLRGIARPTEVTKPILERYQRYLYHYRKKNGRPLSFVSQKTRLVPVRAFFQWLARQNLILSNPAADLELPRTEARLPKAVLSAAEAERVMAVVDLEKPTGIRDRAVLETLYSTGMRRAELIGLHLVDLDAERETVTIRQGKGRKDRMIPIGERALGWIGRYLEELRPKLVVEPDEGTLFLTDSGDSFTPGRLTKLAGGYVERARLGKRGSCHLFRHTMATLMLEGGADIRFIQKMLGHASLNSTEVYTQVSIRKLQEIHRATHPGARAEPTSPAAAASEKTDAADELARSLEADADEDPEL